MTFKERNLQKWVYFKLIFVTLAIMHWNAENFCWATHLNVHTSLHRSMATWFLCSVYFTQAFVMDASEFKHTQLNEGDYTGCIFFKWPISEKDDTSVYNRQTLPGGSTIIYRLFWTWSYYFTFIRQRKIGV